MKLTGWAWDHARAVADRCARRFRSRAEIERYLLAIGWDVDSVGHKHCHVAFASSLNESVAKSSRLWNMTQRGLRLPARMFSL